MDNSISTINVEQIIIGVTWNKNYVGQINEINLLQIFFIFTQRYQKVFLFNFPDLVFYLTAFNFHFTQIKSNQPYFITKTSLVLILVTTLILVGSTICFSRILYYLSNFMHLQTTDQISWALGISKMCQIHSQISQVFSIEQDSSTSSPNMHGLSQRTY